MAGGYLFRLLAAVLAYAAVAVVLTGRNQPRVATACGVGSSWRRHRRPYPGWNTTSTAPPNTCRATGRPVRPIAAGTPAPEDAPMASTRHSGRNLPLLLIALAAAAVLVGISTAVPPCDQAVALAESCSPPSWWIGPWPYVLTATLLVLVLGGVALRRAERFRRRSGRDVNPLVIGAVAGKRSNVAEAQLPTLQGRTASLHDRQDQLAGIVDGPREGRRLLDPLPAEPVAEMRQYFGSRRVGVAVMHVDVRVFTVPARGTTTSAGRVVVQRILSPGSPLGFARPAAQERHDPNAAELTDGGVGPVGGRVEEFWVTPAFDDLAAATAGIDDLQDAWRDLVLGRPVRAGAHPLFPASAADLAGIVAVLPLPGDAAAAGVQRLAQCTGVALEAATGTPVLVHACVKSQPHDLLSEAAARPIRDTMSAMLLPGRVVTVTVREWQARAQARRLRHDAYQARLRVERQRLIPTPRPAADNAMTRNSELPDRLTGQQPPAPRLRAVQQAHLRQARARQQAVVRRRPLRIRS